LLQVEDPLDGPGQRCKPILRRPGKPPAEVEAVEHCAHDLVLPPQHRYGFGRVDAGVPPVVARVPAEGGLQVLRDADVIHDQAGRLVAEHAVDAGDGLHEPVPPHGFVDVHRVQARRVEPGQPHVPHDHQPEGVVRVSDALREQLPTGLASDVGLPVLRIRRRACHDDLDDADASVALPVRCHRRQLVPPRRLAHFQGVARRGAIRRGVTGRGVTGQGA